MLCIVLKDTLSYILWKSLSCIAKRIALRISSFLYVLVAMVCSADFSIVLLHKQYAPGNVATRVQKWTRKPNDMKNNKNDP
jgi:hypothetical protein